MKIVCQLLIWFILGAIVLSGCVAAVNSLAADRPWTGVVQGLLAACVAVIVYGLSSELRRQCSLARRRARLWRVLDHGTR